MSKNSTQSHRSDHGDDPYKVSDSDIAAWAERERKRRQAWLEGPTEEEKQAWARAERRRRIREYNEELLSSELDIDVGEGRRMAERLQRDASLALAGVASRLIESPYRLLGNLIREGRDWEAQHQEQPRKRRRVHLNEDDD